MYLNDWMHCTLNSGALTVTCWLSLTALEAAGLKIWAALESFVKVWTLPKSLAGIKIENLFVSKRVASYRKAGVFKCSLCPICVVCQDLCGTAFPAGGARRVSY